MRITVTSTSTSLEDLLVTGGFTDLKDAKFDKYPVVKIQNIGSNDVYVEKYIAASTTGSHVLKAGNEDDFEMEDYKDFYMIAPSNTEVNVMII